MADFASPIPILLCGKLETHIQATMDIVKPEFQVIKVCSDPEAARAAITALLDPAVDTDEKRTLDGVEYPRPRLVVMGAGYAHEDFTSIRETVAGATSVPWIRPANAKPGAPKPAGPPPAEEIASRVRTQLDAHFKEIKADQGAGEVWWM